MNGPGIFKFDGRAKIVHSGPSSVKCGLKFNFSKKIKVPLKYRDIENPKYKGKVCLYPLGFLIFYFNIIDNLNITLKSKEKKDLPF